MEKKKKLRNVMMSNAYLHQNEPHLLMKLSKREVEKILNKINYQENALVKIYRFNYDSDGKLYSIWQILIKNRLRKFEWLVGLFIFYLFGITITLLSGIIALESVPIPGLYTETCNGRSCTKGLGLKCIDGICQCPADQYYTKGCIDKKSNMETCNNKTSNCKDNTGLTCRDGVCKCDYFYYWNGDMCKLGKNLSESCTSDNQCLTNLMLNCDQNEKKCRCDGNYRFWDGNVCFPKRYRYENCSYDDMCQTDRQLSCVGTYCE
jgi:hypothetical protein